VYKSSLLLVRLHIVWGEGRLVTVAGVCRRRLSGSVTLYGRPAGGFTRAGHAMTQYRLQSNYSSNTAARRASIVTSRYGDTLF